MYQECTHICKIEAKFLQQDFEGNPPISAVISLWELFTKC